MTSPPGGEAPAKRPEDGRQVRLRPQAWWLMFLVSTWVWNFLARLSFEGEPADPLAAAQQFEQELGVELAANLFDIAAAVLAILVVGRMTTRQDAQASRIRTEQDTRSAAFVRTAR